MKLKEYFSDSIDYIKESKRYIYAAIIVFVVTAILGMIFSNQLSFIDEYLAELLAKTEGLGPTAMVLFIFQNNLTSAVFSILLGIFAGIFPLFSDITNGVVLGYVLAKTLEVAGISTWWRLLPHGIFELPAIFISFGLGMKWGFGSAKKYFKEYKKNKKMKRLGIASIALIIIGFAINSIVSLQGKINVTAVVSSALALVGMISFIAVFIFNKQKKIRKFQRECLYNSLKTVLTVILPLLIIAAIIEGLLISFIG